MFAGTTLLSDFGAQPVKHGFYIVVKSFLLENDSAG
jgi:hypothetical protein